MSTLGWNDSPREAFAFVNCLFQLISSTIIAENGYRE